MPIYKKKKKTAFRAKGGQVPGTFRNFQKLSKKLRSERET